MLIKGVPVSKEKQKQGWIVFYDVLPNWIYLGWLRITRIKRKALVWLNTTGGHFYQHALTLLSTWISIYLPGKVYDEITYPFLNFYDCTVEV